MVLVEADPYEPAACELDELIVIGCHARRRDDVQLRMDGAEYVGLEHALDDHNPGIARKVGETEPEMEWAACAGSVRQIGRGEPEVSQPLLRGERQSRLTGLNVPGAITHRDEQSWHEVVFRLPEMRTLPVFPESWNSMQRTGVWKVAIYLLQEQSRDAVSFSRS